METGSPCPDGNLCVCACVRAHLNEGWKDEEKSSPAVAQGGWEKRGRPKFHGKNKTHTGQGQTTRLGLGKIYTERGPKVRGDTRLVNDGSRDRSAEIIEELNQLDGRVRGLSFSRNFGFQEAVTAGLHPVSGDAAVP